MDCDQFEPKSDADHTLEKVECVVLLIIITTSSSSFTICPITILLFVYIL